MSSSRGSAAAAGIPAGSRKMVQSLKEIVSCSDAEIYAALKDCNMDPNEAVNRLLSQDPFHEVKSKREKKKEGKDTPEPRNRGDNNNSSRGGRIGADRYNSRGSSAPYNSSGESVPLAGKSFKKANGSTPSYGSSLSSTPGISGNNRSRGPAGLSDGGFAENNWPSFSTADTGIAPASGFQSAWAGAPGQVSMADIVKMGRPHDKASNTPNASMHNVQDSSIPSHNLRYREDHASKELDSGITSVQHVPVTEEWPSMETPTAAKLNSIPDYIVDAEQHLEASDTPNIDQQSEAEEVEELEDDYVQNPGANDAESDSISDTKIPENDSRGSSLFDNELYKNMGTYQHQGLEFHEGEDTGVSVSSVTRDLQQLNVRTDDRGLPSEGSAPSVVIPEHLQVQNADCSHLSFGSFGAGISAAYSSASMTSVPVKVNLEEPHSRAEISSVQHLDGSSEYYVDESLRNASDGGSLFQRTGASAGSYDPSSASQPEEIKPENAEVAQGNQYSFPSSNSGFTFDDAQHLNAAYSQSSSHMQTLAPYPNVMLTYTNSLPSASSPANVHPTKESDLSYSPFPAAQSMSSKYGNSISSIGGSAMSMSEPLKTSGFSSTPPTPQSLSGTSVATGPPLPQQHLAVHPYSQPTLPLGPFTNMIGYPFLPQSYTYMPSAFQQTFPSNSTYHQSLAAMLPQYKNNVSASNLPQSASGYGAAAFGNTGTIPGNFPMNPPPAPSGTTLSYDDMLSSQFKDRSHLVSLQQNENAAMWLHGHNSRTMSAVPANTYYNFQGQQNQQAGGFRQAQQPSQNYGGLSFPNFYHSQTGISLDQQQNPRDGSIGGLQGQPKQSQIWQNGY